MILTCPECKSRYVVNPGALMPKGRTVRCAKCSHSWFENKPDSEIEIIKPPEVATDPVKQPDTVSENPAKETSPENTNSDNADDNSAEEPSYDFPIQKPKKRRRPVAKTANLPALQNHKYGSSKLGWISLLIFIIVITGSFLLFQNSVINSWPASKKLYVAVGLEDNEQPKVPGVPEIKPINERLLIRDLAPRQESRNNMPHLVIAGNVENISSTEQTIPQLKIILLDENRQNIREWNFDPLKLNASPGEMVNFETSLPNPPATARDISVLFTTN